jgi:hypothetical protein
MAQGYGRFGEHAAFLFKVAAYSLKSVTSSVPLPCLEKYHLLLEHNGYYIYRLF